MPSRPQSLSVSHFLSLSFTLTHSHTLSFTLSHSPSLSITLSLSLSPPLSHSLFSLPHAAIAALVFGAIISATDPISTLAVFQQLRASTNINVGRSRPTLIFESFSQEDFVDFSYIIVLSVPNNGHIVRHTERFEKFLSFRVFLFFLFVC